MEPILTDAIFKHIQMEYMVPHVKENNYDATILNGVQEVIKILMIPAYREEVSAASESYANAMRPWYRKKLSDFILIMLGVAYCTALIISW